MHRFAPLLLVLLFSACADTSTGPQRAARMHPGMTMAEVTALLGNPHSSTHQGALTEYDYVFNQGQASASSYYVIAGPDGRVRSYGPN